MCTSAEKAKWWILDRVDGGAGIFEDLDLLLSDATNLTKDSESIVNIAASYYYWEASKLAENWRQRPATVLSKRAAFL